MPRLANERHELYALHRAKGFTPAKAGLAAGFASGSSTASTLENDPDVHVRIGEIMAELENRKLAAREAAIEAAKTVGHLTGVTKSWVIQKLSENAQLAANDGAYKESNEALKLIGDEFGMFKGDSAQDNDKAQIKPFDLSKLEGAFDGPDAAPRNVTPATPRLPQGADRVMDELPAKPAATQDIPDDVMKLIQGQGKTSAQERAKARRLDTGSETAVALHPSSEPDDGDEAERPWVDVTGKSPEEILRLAKGGKPRPAAAPVSEDHDDDEDEDEEPLEIDEPVFEDDTPPRRSQRGRL